jgi:hypothetical protein
MNVIIYVEAEPLRSVNTYQLLIFPRRRRRRRRRKRKKRRRRR